MVSVVAQKLKEKRNHEGEDKDQIKQNSIEIFSNNYKQICV